MASTKRDGGTDPAGGSLPWPWLFRRVNQRYRAAITPRLAAAGLDDLSQPGIWALMAITRGVNQSSELMTRMGVTKQAISKIVDRLVSSEFVARRPNGADRRRNDLTLTAKGRKAVRVIDAAVQSTEQKMAEELGQESFEKLGRLLEQVATLDVLGDREG